MEPFHSSVPVHPSRIFTVSADNPGLDLVADYVAVDAETLLSRISSHLHVLADALTAPDAQAVVKAMSQATAALAEVDSYARRPRGDAHFVVEHGNGEDNQALAMAASGVDLAESSPMPEFEPKQPTRTASSIDETKQPIESAAMGGVHSCRTVADELEDRLGESWLSEASASHATSLGHVASGAFRNVVKRSMSHTWFRPEVEYLTVAEVIGKCSHAAKFVFFFGGHARFSSRSVQSTYNSMYALSFFVCFCFCLANMFVQTPPYTEGGIDSVTVYLHVVGFHSWSFWHSFVRDPTVERVVNQQCILGARVGWIKNRLNRVAVELKTGAFIFLSVQIILTVLAFFCFPHSATRHWTQDEGPSAHSSYTLVHGIAMWIAIPQHMPAIIAGYGLFFFLLRIHSMDVEKIAAEFDQLTTSPKGSRVDEIGQSIADELCRAAEDAQKRLDANCEKWAFLWLHQLAYAFIQVCSVVVNMRYRIQYEDIWSWDTHTSVGNMKDLFHGFVGLMVLVTSLITPAQLTRVYKLQGRELLVVMRHCSASVATSEQSAGFLSIELRGFTVFDKVIDFSFALKFLTIVGVCASLYIWLETGRTWTNDVGD